MISNVIKSGVEPVPRERLRVLPEQRLRREHLGEQPLRREARPSAPSTSSAPRSAARSSRTSCSSSRTTRARSWTSRDRTTASVAPAAWRTRRPLEPAPGHRHPGPRHRAALPEQPDPAEPDQPHRARDPQRPANYPLPNRDVTGVTGNYVSDSLSTTRAHQGDLRLDWNASANDKLFLRFSIAELSIKTEKTAFPLLLPAAGPSPPSEPGGQLEPRVRPVAHQRDRWSATTRSTTSPRSTTGAGIGNANATYGIPGGQPIAGLSASSGASGLTNVGAAATIEDNLPKSYQLNEKLTWLKGRHSLKFGGQWLQYDQKRFYAGNNGAARPLQLHLHVHRLPFSDFLLDQVSPQGPWRRQPRRPLDPLQNRISPLRPGRLQDPARPDPEPRPALGLHLARSSRRTTGSRTSTCRPPSATGPASRPSRRTAASRTARSTSPSTTGGSRASASPGARPTAGSSAAATASPSTWRAPGSNLRLPLNPPFFFESNVRLRHVDGRGLDRHRLHRARPGHDAHGQRAGLRPEPPAAVHPAVERVRGISPVPRRMSAQVGYVGHHATKLVAPVEGNQPLPGRGRPLDVGAARHAPTALSRSSRSSRPSRPRRRRARSNYNALQASVRQRDWNGLEFLASYTFSKILTNNLGYYGSAGVAAEGAYWVNAYDAGVELRSRLPRRPPQLRLRRQLRAAVGQGQEVGLGVGRADRRDPGRLEGLGHPTRCARASPSPSRTATDGRCRGPRSTERPNCVGQPGAREPEHHVGPERSQRQQVARHQRVSRRPPLGTFGNCGIGIVDAPGYTNIDPLLAKRFNVGGARYLEFRAEAFNALQPPELRPARVATSPPPTRSASSPARSARRGSIEFA